MNLLCQDGQGTSCPKDIYLLLVLFAISMTVNLVQNLTLFGYLSFISTLFFVIIFISILVYNIIYITTTQNDMTEQIFYFDIKNFLFFFIQAYFSVSGISLVLPIRGELHNSADFNYLFFALFGFVIWCYMVLALLSYFVS